MSERHFTDGLPLTLPVEDDIQLRVPSVADAAALFAVIDANREHLSRWLTWLDAVQTVHDEQTTLAIGTELQSARNRRYVICVANRICGSIDLRPTAVSDTGEIGYWLAADAQGRGIVTRAMRTLSRRALVDTPYQRLVIHAAVDNTASNAVAARAGFRFTGILPGAEHLAQGICDANVWTLAR